MKKIIILAFVALAIGLNTRCNLDQLPTNKVAAEEGLLTMKDAQQFATGILVSMRAKINGEYNYCFEQQSDLYNATISNGNRGNDIHAFVSGNFNAKTYAVENLFNGYYSTIAQCNFFLDKVDDVETADAADQALIERYKGEVYFVRAYCYHQLAKIYCADYEPSTASTEVGMPIVLTFDVNAKPSRSSLEATYGQIMIDIVAAETRLVNVAGVVRSNRPTLDAVKALRARVELSMHKYTEAAATAAALIAKPAYALASTSAQMTNEWVNDNGTECIMQMAAYLGEALQTNGLFLNIASNGTTYSPDYLPTKTVIDLYESSDLRLSSFFTTASDLPLRFQGTNYTTIKALKKYPGNPELRSTSLTNYFHKGKVFRIAEMYLIQAEALWRTSGDPRPVLNALRSKRGASQLVGGDAATHVKNEWIREMIGEGHRIECLKRWNNGFVGRVPQNSVAVQNLPASSYTEIVVNANDYRFIWPIPYDQLINNKNLTQHPRWL